jgi:NAD(P)-dependent dehydrogenase (short-subunit alcohol dehydrogenase family)
VLFADLKEQEAAEASEESKKTAISDSYKSISCAVDITDVESVKSMVDLAVKEFGRIDYLVNSAGVCPDMSFQTKWLFEC